MIMSIPEKKLNSEENSHKW